MAAANLIMSLRRPQIWSRFRMLNSYVKPAQHLTVEQAWRAGLKQGYQQGMLDGLTLGMEIGAVVAIGGSDALDPLDFV